MTNINNILANRSNSYSRFEKNANEESGKSESQTHETSNILSTEPQYMGKTDLKAFFSIMANIQLNVLPHPGKGFGKNIIPRPYPHVKFLSINSGLLPFLSEKLHLLAELVTLIIGSEAERNFDNESTELSNIKWDRFKALSTLKLFSGTANHAVASISQIFSLKELTLSIQLEQNVFEKLLMITNKIAHLFLVCKDKKPIPAYLSLGMHQFQNLSLFFGSKNTKEVNNEYKELSTINWNRLENLKRLEVYSGRVTECVEQIVNLKSLEQLSITILAKTAAINKLLSITDKVKLELDLVCDKENPSREQNKRNFSTAKVMYANTTQKMVPLKERNIARDVEVVYVENKEKIEPLKTDMSVLSPCEYPVTLHIMKGYIDLPNIRDPEQAKWIHTVNVCDPLATTCLDGIHEKQFLKCEMLSLFHSQLNHDLLLGFPNLRELTIKEVTENNEFCNDDLKACPHLRKLNLTYRTPPHVPHELELAAKKINAAKNPTSLASSNEPHELELTAKKINAVKSPTPPASPKLGLNRMFKNLFSRNTRDYHRMPPQQ